MLNHTHDQISFELENYEGDAPSRQAVGPQIRRIRDVMSQYFVNHPVELGGPGEEVQIDETVIGRRKYNVSQYCLNL
jgi:hypothetical protein